MRKLLFPGLLCALLLTACGSGDNPTPVADQPSDQATATQPTDRPAAAATDSDEKPELVEESAAESVEEPAGDVPLMLAQADTGSAAGGGKFREGKDYFRLVPTQPTVGGSDKIEVTEVFWYGCPHCYDFEPFLQRWLANKPANVRFVRIPATWNSLVKRHAQLYYTEEVLATNGKLKDAAAFHQATFDEYHLRHNRLTSDAAIQGLFQRFGVSESDFQNTWKSFEVMQKLRVADDLQKRYGVTGVPTIVVNGKYRATVQEPGEAGLQKVIDILDELVAKESAR